MEDRLDGRLPQPEAVLRRDLRVHRHPGGVEGVFLDSLAGTPRAGRPATCWAILPAAASPAEMVELDAALDLFVPMWTAHMAAPQLRWSYYLSARGDLMTMFPFAPSSDFIAQGDYPTMRDLIAGWLGYDVFVDGTPAAIRPAAPTGQAPTRTRGGAAGWSAMRRRSMPAAASWASSAPTSCCRRCRRSCMRSTGRWGRSGSSTRRDGCWPRAIGRRAEGGGTATLAQLLPASLAELPMAELLAAQPGFTTLAGHAVMAEPLPRTPYTLLYVVPERALTWMILPRLAPYALILVGLVLTLLAAFALMQHRVVGPALALVRHIQDESQGTRASGTLRLPARWRPWFTSVSEAFAAQPPLSGAAGRERSEAEGRGGEHPRRPRDLRLRGPAGLLQQPLSRAPDRARRGRPWRWASGGPTGYARRRR